MTTTSKIDQFYCAVALAAFTVFVLSARLYAGLATPTADIEANNLRIGQTYNLTQMANLPFKVTAMHREHRVRLTLLVPTTGQCRPGFEPLPDITWVTISRNGFDLLSGETGEADITISIPNDEKYMGRNFEVKLLAVTTPKTVPMEESGASIGVGVMASLRFKVAAKPLTEEEKEKFKKAEYKAVNIELTPNDLFLEDSIEVGKKVDIEKKFGKTLKLVNTGEAPVKVRVRSVSLAESGIQPPAGWEAGPDASYIVIPREKVKIRPLEVKKLPFFVYIPNEERFRGKKYFFIVEVSVEDELVKTSYRSKIYVITR